MSKIYWPSRIIFINADFLPTYLIRIKCDLTNEFIIRINREADMNILTMLILAALLITVGVILTGIWSMAHGGEFDQKHSTQLMAARIGMQGVTILLLLFAIFLAA